VQLTESQVQEIIRAAGVSQGLRPLLEHLERLREGGGEDPQSPERALANPNLSQSFLLGLLVLCYLPSDGSYVANAELSEIVGVPTSTMHRYLSTLVAVGIVERHPSSRKYRLLRAE
jgi:uncharacterized membrane protein